MSVAGSLSSPLSRRFFLSRGAAISTVGLPAIAAPALAAPPLAAAALPAVMAAARASESPQIVALAAQLPLLRARYLAAAHTVEEAQARALAADPPYPPELTPPPNDPLFGGISWGLLRKQTDILGRERETEKLPDGKFRSHPCITARDCSTDPWPRISISDKTRARLARLLEIVHAFDAERERIRQEVGLPAAQMEEFHAGREVAEACRLACSIEAKTVLGLLVKSQAISFSLIVKEAGAYSVGARNAAHYAQLDLVDAVSAVLGEHEDGEPLS
jgi:hypothetical protein